MSYESKMFEQFAMPTRKQVEQALLRSLLKHGGVIREFGSGQEIVDESIRQILYRGKLKPPILSPTVFWGEMIFGMD